MCRERERERRVRTEGTDRNVGEGEGAWEKLQSVCELSVIKNTLASGCLEIYRRDKEEHFHMRRRTNKLSFLYIVHALLENTYRKTSVALRYISVCRSSSHK